MTRLYLAAKEVLNNALDAGYYGPGVSKKGHLFDDHNYYPIDADGDLWFEDFWELNNALEKEEKFREQFKKDLSIVLDIVKPSFFRFFKRKLTKEESAAIIRLRDYVSYMDYVNE